MESLEEPEESEVILVDRFEDEQVENVDNMELDDLEPFKIGKRICINLFYFYLSWNIWSVFPAKKRKRTQADLGEHEGRNIVTLINSKPNVFLTFINLEGIQLLQRQVPAQNQRNVGRPAKKPRFDGPTPSRVFDLEFATEPPTLAICNYYFSLLWYYH